MGGNERQTTRAGYDLGERRRQVDYMGQRTAQGQLPAWMADPVRLVSDSVMERLGHKDA